MRSLKVLVMHQKSCYDSGEGEGERQATCLLWWTRVAAHGLSR